MVDSKNKKISSDAGACDVGTCIGDGNVPFLSWERCAYQSEVAGI